MSCSGEIRILLVGQTGSGVSSTANSILKEHFFDAKNSASSVTYKSSRGETFYDGRKIIVADTPGFLHNKLEHKEVESEMRRAIQLLEPGPHIILYVIRKDIRYSDNEALLFRNMFGNKCFPYVIVVFTGSDDENWGTLEEYSEHMSTFCKNFFRKFDSRSLHVDNRCDLPGKGMMIRKLVELVCITIERNQGSFYKESMIPKAISITDDMKGHPIFQKGVNLLKKNWVKYFITVILGGTLFYIVRHLLIQN